MQNMTPIAPARNVVVAYGEVLLRLKSPGFERLLQSPRLEVCIGGAELNVLASLARFGHAARLVTTLPENALGAGALAEIRALCIGTDDIALRRSGRMGLYFAESGQGFRTGQVIYDRAGSSFALDEDVRSWTDLLSEATLLHLTGITPTLSLHCAASGLAGAQHARRMGLKVSLDVNFRAQLWATAPQSQEVALVPILHQAHIVFASSADLAAAFGLPCERQAESPIDNFQRLSAQALERLPQLEVICTYLRSGEHADSARLIAVGRSRSGFYRSTERLIHSMADRIGTGDAFAAGVLHWLLRGFDIDRALEFGLAAAALKHSIPGDVNRVTEAEVTACLSGVSAGILRR